MFGRHVFKVKSGKCLFINISKNKVEIRKFNRPPKKKLIVTSDKVFKIMEYEQLGRVFLFVDGEIKNNYD